MTFLPSGRDRSGTTSEGSKVVAPANSKRRGLTFQNTADVPMYVNETGGEASPNSGYLVAPGAGVNVSTNQGVSVYCAEASKPFAAVEW